MARSRLILPPGYEESDDGLSLATVAERGAEGGMGMEEDEGPHVPEDVLPTDGLISMARRLQGGYDNSSVDGLVAETDRVHRMLRDDPSPDVPFLALPDTEIIRVFESRLRHFASFRESRERIWMKAWKDYNQVLGPDIDKWKSKVFLPFLYTLVSSALPAAVAAAFDSGDFVKYVASYASEEENAETLTILVDHFLKVKMPARREVRDWLLYAYLYGTGIMRLGWRYETRLMRVPMPVYDVNPMTGEREYLGNRLVQKVVTTHDEPEMVSVDIWNAFLAPHTTRGDARIPCVIERIETTEEDLLETARQGGLGPMGYQKVQAWLNSNPILQLDDGSIYSHLAGRTMALQEIGLASPYELMDHDDDLDSGPRPVVLYAMYTRDYVVTLTGDGSRTVIGKQPNPYLFDDLPFVLFHWDRKPKDPYGIGMGQVAGPVQSQVNFDYNHHNDGRRLRLYAPLKVRRVGNSLVEGDLELKPGKLIRVREMDDVEPLELPDTTGDMAAHQGMLIDHANKATGINDLARGFTQQGSNTATEASLQDSYTSLRRGEHVNELAAGIQGIGRRLGRLCQQFVTQEIAVRIAGSVAINWKTITPDKIIGEFGVVASPSLLKSNPESLRRDWTILYPQLMGHPLVVQEELLRRYLKVFQQDHLEDLILPPPPPAQMPEDEELVLDLGLEVHPSPDEDFMAHLQLHSMKTAMLEAQQPPDTRAIAAHKAHMTETWQMMVEVQSMISQGAGTPANGAGGAARPGGSGSPVRNQATALGQGQGSDGPKGRSPGPAAPPGRARKASA